MSGIDDFLTTLVLALGFVQCVRLFVRVAR